jgi:hypothetical protein
MVSTRKDNARHSGAGNAVKKLKDSRFDVKKPALAGSDYHSNENEDVASFDKLNATSLHESSVPSCCPKPAFTNYL